MIIIVLSKFNDNIFTMVLRMKNGWGSGLLARFTASSLDRFIALLSTRVDYSLASHSVAFGRGALRSLVILSGG